ncbi:putative effector protein [Aphelenchoides fujianensis]|nr:putative effector protein [Aphelenchoides fujianensis]
MNSVCWMLVLVLAFGCAARRENWTVEKAVSGGHSRPNSTVNEENPQARCYDARLASYLNTGLSYYAHDMGQLSKYILDQITRAGMSGYWFVHSEMINGRRQGLDWQTLTSGDIFQPSSTHGCYYHDTKTFVVILRY